MTSLIPESLALLSRAALLRADGTPWADVATQLAVGVDELRRLASENARAFDKLARRAAREFKQDAMYETVARLRALLKSNEQGIALMAATTLVRYDLAKMRHDLQVERKRVQNKMQRLRNELPPLPNLTVTAEKKRCDTTAARPETPKPQRVVAEPVAAQELKCDTVTPPQPVPASPPANGSLQPANPGVKKGKAITIDSIRRKRWHLARCMNPDAVEQDAAVRCAGGNKRRVLEVERLMRGCLAE